MNDANRVTRLNAALEGCYRIESELGEGGMATVYLADDLKHERKVALKVLKSELAAVVGAERFLAEIKTTANLQHPHILPLFDSGEADSFLFYVMPYVEGESLRDRLERERQLPVDEAVRIAMDVAEALHSAHEQGVIHRDIKPANILMSKGRPLVADFGIALAVGAAGGGRLTETGLSLGTPHYMSPEQATGDLSVGAATDVYALGCVLYEMLVGEPPYTGSTAQAILGKILAGKLASAAEARASVPANVEAAIRKALEKLPADRFTGAQGFAKALAEPGFRYGEPRAADAGVATGSWKRPSVVTTVMLVAISAVALWGWLRPEAPKPVVRYALAPSEEEALQAAYGTSVALSPDGSRLVYVRPSDEAEFQLWLRERDQLRGTPLAGTEAASEPFFSPDGQRVAFVTGDRQLKVASLIGEPPLTLVESGVSNVGGAWGADGYVYFLSLPWRLMRVRTTGGGVPESVAMPDTTLLLEPRWPDVLPNGKGVLLTVGANGPLANESDSVAVVDLATGEHRVLVQGIFGRYAASGHLVYVRHDGALLAAPFDQDRLVLTGPPVALPGEIAVRGGPDVALSETGRLVYAAGTETSQEVVWVDQDGTARPIDPDWTGVFESVALSPDGTGWRLL